MGLLQAAQHQEGPGQWGESGPSSSSTDLERGRSGKGGHSGVGYSWEGKCTVMQRCAFCSTLEVL